MARLEDNPGHVCGAGSREGGYQFTNLDDTGVVITLPVGQEGEFVRIRWLPVDVNAGPLFYAFFADLTAANAGFDAGTDTVSSARVPTAPDWIERGGEDVQVPDGRRHLRLESAVGKMRVLVRSADRQKTPVGSNPDV